MESVAHATGGLLRLAAEVQVLAPPALVSHMIDTIRAMAGIYSPTGPPASSATTSR
ncbi:hypothetical protein ACFQZH_41075 [Paractinoplanes durhamensis]